MGGRFGNEAHMGSESDSAGNDDGGGNRRRVTALRVDDPGV
jgi:hypothetical protein